MTLPPDVSQSNFDKAIESFSGAVGAEWVFTSQEPVSPRPNAS